MRKTRIKRMVDKCFFIGFSLVLNQERMKNVVERYAQSLSVFRCHWEERSDAAICIPNAGVKGTDCHDQSADWSRNDRL